MGSKSTQVSPVVLLQRSDLKHDVVRDVRLSTLHSLQGEGVPQVKEGAQVHQHRMGQMPNIHSPCKGGRNQSSLLHPGLHAVKLITWKF